MSAGQFESLDVPAARLAGQVSADIFDPGLQPAAIVKSTAAWSVGVTWQLTGDLVPWLSGIWHVQVLADRKGGPTTPHPPTPMDVAFTPGNGDYSVTIPMANELVAGLYEITVNLTSTKADGTTGDMGGFVSVGEIKVQA